MKTNITYNDLIAYVHLLKDLKETGVKCDQEISKAIKALNEMVFVEEEEKFDHVNVIVLVDNLQDYENAVDSYHNILRIKRFPPMSPRYGYEQFANSNTMVRVIDVNKVDDIKMDNLRGIRVDIVDNKTRHTPTKLFLGGAKIKMRGSK